uniref:transposase n=21 Tax=Enterobacteriaceae TaxID=543 RepID=UPI000A4E174C
MSRKTQRYSKEFKAEAVRTVLENQLSISEGASRLSLPEGTLGQWVTAARKGLGTPGSRTVAELESEILQLRKALNEARLERDILKKATVDSICQCNTPFNYLFRCEGTLGQWVTAARKGLGTPGSRTVAELESEILQLRKALNEARLERDILKKATVDS